MRHTEHIGYKWKKGDPLSGWAQIDVGIWTRCDGRGVVMRRGSGWEGVASRFKTSGHAYAADAMDAVDRNLDRASAGGDARPDEVVRYYLDTASNDAEEALGRCAEHVAMINRELEQLPPEGFEFVGDEISAIRWARDRLHETRKQNRDLIRANRALREELDRTKSKAGTLDNLLVDRTTERDMADAYRKDLEAERDAAIARVEKAERDRDAIRSAIEGVREELSGRGYCGDGSIRAMVRGALDAEAQKLADEESAHLRDDRAGAEERRKLQARVEWLLAERDAERKMADKLAEALEWLLEEAQAGARADDGEDALAAHRDARQRDRPAPKP